MTSNERLIQIRARHNVRKEAWWCMGRRERQDAADDMHRDIAYMLELLEAKPFETSGDRRYEQDYTIAELASLCRTKDRHIARIEAEQEARAAGETKAPHECRRGPSCGMLDGAWECNCAPESCGDPILRRLLWLCYTHGVGYRDDGELQDNRAQPFIDFRRDAPHDIEEKMRERGYRQLVAAEKARGEA